MPTTPQPATTTGTALGLRASAARRVLHGTSQWAIWLVVVAAALIGQLLSPFFLTKANMLNLLAQASVLGIAAVGVTFVMLIAELDVSIAGTATVGAILGAAVMNGQDGQIVPAVAVTLGFGALVGLVNGILVSRGVQSFILTLAVGTTLLAAGAMYTGGTPLGIVAPGYTTFFSTPRLGVPTPAWAVLIVVAVTYLVQRFTRFGHRIFLVGDNRLAAYFSGIHVNVMVVGAFMLSGAFAALAGLVLLGRSGVPNDFSGMNLHFQALAAVALGGTAFAGGRGSVIGTFAGTILIAISLGLGILLGWPFGAQLVEYGVLILIATVLYSLISGESKS
jgi:ribose/xylose/arabinose/galactoside ABC-type transport system permease subunit